MMWRQLLGMKWHDQFHVDLVLPFGLRSAPFIFNSVADMVEWILVNSYQIPHLLHYLDDLITAGPPRSLQCAQNLATLWKSSNGLVCPCILASVWAPLWCPLWWTFLRRMIDLLCCIPEERSPHSSQSRISSRSSVMAPVFGGVAWR